MTIGFDDLVYDDNGYPVEYWDEQYTECEIKKISKRNEKFLGKPFTTTRKQTLCIETIE